jgi:hypothetical protein
VDREAEQVSVEFVLLPAFPGILHPAHTVMIATEIDDNKSLLEYGFMMPGKTPIQKNLGRCVIERNIPDKDDSKAGDHDMSEVKRNSGQYCLYCRL